MKIIKTSISAEVTVKKPVEKVWKLWTTPTDISGWNNLSDDWHSPLVEIDLKNEGRFLFRMEKKDGSAGFDHGGKYDKVIKNELIEYTVSDGRKSSIAFIANNNETTIIETFEPEAETPIDLQRDFCQAILNNFKRYAEDKIHQ